MRKHFVPRKSILEKFTVDKNNSELVFCNWKNNKWNTEKINIYDNKLWTKSEWDDNTETKELQEIDDQINKIFKKLNSNEELIVNLSWKELLKIKLFFILQLFRNDKNVFYGIKDCDELKIQDIIKIVYIWWKNISKNNDASFNTKIFNKKYEYLCKYKDNKYFKEINLIIKRTIEMYNVFFVYSKRRDFWFPETTQNLLIPIEYDDRSCYFMTIAPNILITISIPIKYWDSYKEFFLKYQKESERKELNTFLIEYKYKSLNFLKKKIYFIENDEQILNFFILDMTCCLTNYEKYFKNYSNINWEKKDDNVNFYLEMKQKFDKNFSIKKIFIKENDFLLEEINFYEFLEYIQIINTQINPEFRFYFKKDIDIKYYVQKLIKKITPKNLIK